MTSQPNLYDPSGLRLYLTADERQAFHDAARALPRERRTFCQTLYWTGCRTSEALQLTYDRVDLSGHMLVFRTLKKHGAQAGKHYRGVPVPAAFMDTLDMVHDVRGTRSPDATLWDFDRTTAWRIVKETMAKAGIDTALPHATCKGLRHAYGMHAVNSDVPLNMVQKWLGHASPETTAVYVNAVGKEQQDLAARMWR